MASRTSGVRTGLLLGLAVLLAAGCGGDPGGASVATERPASTAPTERSSSPAVAPDLEDYLLQADEVPGLTPVGSPITDTGEPFDLPPEGVDVLDGVGYVSTTYQPAEGENSAGVSSVLLFESEQGARDWMAYETSAAAIEHQIPNATLERFEVPGLPGATGWTGPDLHGNAIGQLYWTQGRCMLLIGLEVEGPRVDRLRAGALAIYERTGGSCPS